MQHPDYSVVGTILDQFADAQLQPQDDQYGRAPSVNDEFAAIRVRLGSRSHALQFPVTGLELPPPDGKLRRQIRALRAAC